MAITIQIHGINIESKSCIVTIKDDGDLVCGGCNIGLQVTAEGEPDMDWVKGVVKSHVQMFRKKKIIPPSLPNEIDTGE